MSNFSDYSYYRDPNPGPLTDGQVRGIAGRIAGSMIADARASDGPTRFVTGNSYMPPLRSFTEAERVYHTENNDDGELFQFLFEEIERHLNGADVLMQCPDYDNAIYVVDMRRWHFVEFDNGDTLDDEWEAAETEEQSDNYPRIPELEHLARPHESGNL